MLKRHCDRCGKEIPNCILGESTACSTIIVKRNPYITEVELCNDCAKGLEVYLHSNTEQKKDNVVHSYKSVSRDPFDNSL